GKSCACSSAACADVAPPAHVARTLGESGVTADLPGRADRQFIRPGLIRAVNANAWRPYQVAPGKDKRQSLAFPGRNARLLQEIFQGAAWTVAVGLQALPAAARANCHPTAQPRDTHPLPPPRRHDQNAAEFRERQPPLAAPASCLTGARCRERGHHVEPVLEASHVKLPQRDQYLGIPSSMKGLLQRFVELRSSGHQQAMARQKIAHEVARTRRRQPAQRCNFEHASIQAASSSSRPAVSAKWRDARAIVVRYAGKRRARSGSTSCRRKLRAKRTSALDSSSTHSIPRCCA